MPLLQRIRTMAAKIETTVGSVESLTAAEGVYNAYDLKIDGEIEVETREAQGSFNFLPGVPGPHAGSMSFKTDMGWDGSAMPKWASVLMTACGFVESTQVFTPRSEALGSNVKSVTIGVYENGLYKKLAGAVGTFKINCPAGKICMIEWDFKGVWQSVTDAAIIAPTYPTDLPIRFASATITYNSIEQCVENFTFDAGNEIILRECPDTVAGYKSGLIVDRKPMITINPEAQLVATENRYAHWMAGSEYAFSVVLDGPAGDVSNGTIEISAPKAQIMNIKEGSRNKLLIDDVELMCNKNGATKDQEVSITFTDKVD